MRQPCISNPSGISIEYTCFASGSITNSVIVKGSGWVAKKPFAQVYGFKNTPLLPQRDLGGGTASLSCPSHCNLTFFMLYIGLNFFKVDLPCHY